MFSGFTVSGASLQVLNVGDRGTIARFPRADPSTLSHLQELGLDRGTEITVTQRYPNFRVSTKDGYLTLPPSLVQAIYVRLIGGDTSF
jgi:Fe2+ transport system protein FeoA